MHQPLHPTRPTAQKPTKPDYFPLSRVRRPLGPAIYPGAAAAEDVANGLLVSDALHDMTLYTEVSNSLPDAGRPVLNSVFFSQRHIVNDTPSIEEELVAINERTRLWRASRLQQVITEREHIQQQMTLDEKVETRVREWEIAERERTLRRITRMLDSLIPEVEKALTAHAEVTHDFLGVRRREEIMKQFNEREELHGRLIRDMRLAERRRLVERQYQRNIDERHSLESQHYFSYMELLIDERREYRQLKEVFYNGKILFGVIDDESKMRCRVWKIEANNRLNIIEEVCKLIPLLAPQPLGESGVDTEQMSSEIHTDNREMPRTTEKEPTETAVCEEAEETSEHEGSTGTAVYEEAEETSAHGVSAGTTEDEEAEETAEHGVSAEAAESTENV